MSPPPFLKQGARLVDTLFGAGVRNVCPLLGQNRQLRCFLLSRSARKRLFSQTREKRSVPLLFRQRRKKRDDECRSRWTAMSDEVLRTKREPFVLCGGAVREGAGGSAASLLHWGGEGGPELRGRPRRSHPLKPPFPLRILARRPHVPLRAAVAANQQSRRRLRAAINVQLDAVILSDLRPVSGFWRAASPAPPRALPSPPLSRNRTHNFHPRAHTALRA